MKNNAHCVICNEIVDAMSRGGFGFFLTYPGRGEGHYKAPAYLVHEACARKAADPEFSFDYDATGHDLANPDRWEPPIQGQ